MANQSIITKVAKVCRYAKYHGFNFNLDTLCQWALKGIKGLKNSFSGQSTKSRKSENQQAKQNKVTK